MMAVQTFKNAIRRERFGTKHNKDYAMKHTNNKILPCVYVLIPALLTGCGGGGGGTTTPVAPAAVFDLAAAQDNIYNDSTFNLTGSDNQGGNYTSSMIFTNQGVQPVNGVNATHIRLDLTLTETTTNAFVAGTQDLYFTTGYATVLQVSNPGNIQYIPTSVTALPASGSIGDSGPMGAFSKSNGETEVDTWSLDPAANGRAILTFHATVRDATNTIVEQESHAFTIDAAGRVFSLTSQINYPSGFALTLSGNKQ